MSTDERTLQPKAEEPGVLTELSEAMLRVYNEKFERTSMTARCFWAGPDAIACFLEHMLTPAERKPVHLGKRDLVRDTRLVQYTGRRAFCEPVQRITGRKVRSFHSSIDTEVDGQAVETFILYPKGQDGPSPCGLACADEV